MKKITPRQYARHLIQVLETASDADQTQVIAAFAQLLVERRQRRLVPQILTELAHELDVRSGVVRGRLQIALPLTSSAVDDIATLLSKKLGKKVELEAETAEELIGGVVVRVEDTVYDASVRTHLERLRQNVETYG